VGLSYFRAASVSLDQGKSELSATLNTGKRLYHCLYFVLMIFQLSNSRRHFFTLGRKLDDYKRIVRMLSSNDVAGLRRLLSAAHRRGASPAKICSLLERAITGLYRPRGGFVKHDLDITFLVKAIGGPRLLYALGKSHGLASWRTAKHHLKIPKLLPSVAIPSADEISRNVSSFFDPEVKPPLEHAQNGCLPGNVVMFDGIALETTMPVCMVATVTRNAGPVALLNWGM
jgi:hypothetical protein